MSQRPLIVLLVTAALLSGSAAAQAASAQTPAPIPSPSPTPAAKILDTVIVTPERRPTTVRTTSREAYVLTSDELRVLGAPTISDALEFVPGVFVKKNGALGGVESVLMRGASSEQTLVLIDGRPASDADLGDFDFSSIASDAVERVEVVEGGASTLYGSNAVGGVVNIITASPGGQSASAYDEIGFEGANATGFRIATGDAHSKGASIAFRSSHARDEFDYPSFLTIPSGTRTDDDAKVQDLSVGLSRLFGDVRGSLRFNDDASDVGAPGDLEFCAAPPDDAFCPSGLARQQRIWGRSDAQAEWQSGAHVVTVQAYADGRRLHFYDGGTSFPFDTLTTLTTRGDSVRDVWTANASNVIVAGFDARGRGLVARIEAQAVAIGVARAGVIGSRELGIGQASE